jgi:LAS superfamily LD-carboxypeptidase LdcB
MAIREICIFAILIVNVIVLVLIFLTIKNMTTEDYKLVETKKKEHEDIEKKLVELKRISKKVSENKKLTPKEKKFVKDADKSPSTKELNKEFKQNLESLKKLMIEKKEAP